MEERTEVLIVGGGPAGYTAALYCARAGVETLVLEAAAPGGQMGETEAVDNYPGFPETMIGAELGENMRRGAERFGGRTVLAKVSALELSGEWKRADTAGGSYFGRALIYAAGAAPRMLDIPGEQALRGRGVSFCAACDGAFFRGRTVAVVGGGASAASEALTLARLCAGVTVLCRGETLRAERADLAALAAAKNMTVLCGARAEAILGETVVTGVRYTADGRTKQLDCDGVFVAVGRAPNTALLAGQVTLGEGGYVAAGESTCTSVSGVFAAGDVRTKPLRQIVTAAGDGAVAAHFALEHLRR